MKATKKDTSPALPASLSFEQAIARLEKIVAEMEGAELPLEDVLKKYEEGSRLVRFCGQKLDAAEQRIELIAKKGGAVELKPFPAAATEPDDAGQDATLL